MVSWLIVLMVALAVVGVVLVVKGIRAGKTEYWIAGLCLLAGDGFGLVAQLNSDDEAEKRATKMTAELRSELGKSLSQMGLLGRVEAIGPLVGSNEVAQYVVQKTLNNDFQYEDYSIQVHLSNGPKGWFRVRERITAVILNPENSSEDKRPRDYPFNMTFNDLQGPPSGEQGKAAAFDTVMVTQLDSRGKPTSELPLLWVGKAILDEMTNPPGKRYTTMRKTITFAPGERRRLLIVMSAWEPMNGGEVSVQTRFPTVNMDAEVVIENPDYEAIFDFWHSWRDAPNICVRIPDPAAHRWRAKIVGGMLPYQGMIITWATKDGE